MKTLDEITAEINETKERILCQEIGNDTYYTSPLYHRHLTRLQELEQEQSILLGKSAPIAGYSSDFITEKRNTSSYRATNIKDYADK